MSDFGHKDPYVAEMKAVILSINSQVNIVDISHEIEKFNIRMGAYILASVVPFFPQNTIHVAVVDPGVGTKRYPIIVETNRSLFVGPDNGLLLLAAHNEEILNVYSINNTNFMQTKISKTFHGRDIFAPTAAYLTKGIKPSIFGSRIKNYFFPDFAETYLEKGELFGEIMYIDDFGNIISNISRGNLEHSNIHNVDSLLITLKDKTLNIPFCSAYGEVPVGSPLVLIGSNDFLEVAINQGNASNDFNVDVGDLFRIAVTPFT
jgi:S-adenosylmethionine hydrolase